MRLVGTDPACQQVSALTLVAPEPTKGILPVNKQEFTGNEIRRLFETSASHRDQSFYDESRKLVDDFRRAILRKSDIIPYGLNIYFLIFMKRFTHCGSDSEDILIYILRNPAVTTARLFL